jgi:hypothetical protein
MRPSTCALLVALLVLGCGQSQSSNLVPVAGTVTLDGQPLGNATLFFMPQGETKGNGGGGTTDAAGKYQANSVRGEKGLHPGSYKVTVSRRLMPDGKPPPPDDKPMESPARESLPGQYSDQGQTTLTANVAAGGGPIDFALKSAPRR